MVHLSNVLLAVVALSSTVLALPTGMDSGIQARAPVKISVNTKNPDPKQWVGSAATKYQALEQQRKEAEKRMKDAQMKQDQMKKGVTSSYRTSDQAAKAMFGRREIYPRAPVTITQNTKNPDPKQWTGSGAVAYNRLEAERKQAEQKMKEAQRKQDQMKTGAVSTFKGTNEAAASRFRLRDLEEVEA